MSQSLTHAHHGSRGNAPASTTPSRSGLGERRLLAPPHMPDLKKLKELRVLLDDGVRADASKQQPASKQNSKSRRRRCVRAGGRRPPPPTPRGVGPRSPLRIPFGRNNGAANDAAANKKWDLEMVGFLRPTRVQAHFTYVEGCRAHLRSRYIALAVVRVS